MGEWKKYKLGDFGTVVTGNTPSSKNPEDWGDEMLFVTPSDYKNYLKYANCSDRKLSSIGFNRLNKKILPPNSLLVTCIGSDMGKVAKASDYCITNQQINSIIPNDNFDSDFIYYKLIDLYDTLRIYGGDGTAVPIVNKTDFENIAAEVPENKEEQERIAGILSSLDDKIDLLGRQNATLEAMAETLFRQYFIESPKADWKDGVVADIAKHSKIAIHPQKQPAELFCHYSIPSFDNAKTPTLDLSVEIQSSKYKVPSNSILFSKLNPHKDKRVWLLLDNVEESSICSTEFQIVEPIIKEYLYFIYGWLTHSENYNDIASGVGGTSGSHQRIDPATIFSFTCPIIDLDYIRLYNSQVKPMFEKQINNQKQIRSLTKLRDTLLPKLMNNAIKI